MIRFLDGFDHYATADLTDGWTQVYAGDSSKLAVSAATGRRSTSSLRVTGGDSFSGATNAPLGIAGLGSTDHTVIVGFSFRLAGTGAAWGQLYPWTIPSNGTVTPASVPVLSWRLSSILSIRQGGYTQVALMPHTNGTLSVVRCGDTGVSFTDQVSAILGTTTYALQAGQTYYIELKVKIHASAGTVDLRVNGDSWLSLSGVDTQSDSYVTAARWDEIVIGTCALNGTSFTHYWDYDDLYIADIDSSNTNNTVVDFLGDIALTWRNPTADGAMSDFTRSTGSDNYALVDEDAPDDDGTYNHTTVVDDIDTFVMENAPVAGINVIAVAVVHSARRVEGGDTSTAGVLRIGSTNYAGDARGNTTSYSYDQYIVDRKPSNQAVFSESDFNALEVGYKKVS